MEGNERDERAFSIVMFLLLLMMILLMMMLLKPADQYHFRIRLSFPIVEGEKRGEGGNAMVMVMMVVAGEEVMGIVKEWW